VRSPRKSAAIALAGALALAACKETGEGGSGGGRTDAGADADPCISCANAITQGGKACEGAPLDAYDALITCACGKSGACADACAENLCGGAAAVSGCGECIEDKCHSEFTGCAND
jgi:hypothetical protein